MKPKMNYDVLSIMLGVMGAILGISLLIGVAMAGVFTLSQIVFIALKLSGVIMWTWLWVFFPVWLIPLVIFSLFVILMFLGFVADCVLYMVNIYKYKREKQ